VDKAVTIGAYQMQQYKREWPGGFRKKLSNNVESMWVTRKHIQVSQTKVFNTNLIHSRVISLQASSREIDIKNILSYELAPVPTSIFTELGDMRIAKAKSQLKKLFQKEVSSRYSLKESLL